MHTHIPKDRGWAWMVVLGAFLVNMLVVGVTAKSFGILFKRLKDELEHSSRATLFIVAISQCLAMVLGPFANMLVMRFTSRWVVFTGGLIISLGFVLSRFTTSIYQLYLTYGVLVGIGSAMAYAPSIITTMQYFDKRKALANGIAVAGGGIGNFAAPPLMQLLLDRYDLAGAFLILAGLMLHVCLSGALFRPHSFYARLSRRSIGDGSITSNAAAGMTEAQRSQDLSKLDTCETICQVDEAAAGTNKAADSVHLLQTDASKKPAQGCSDEGYSTSNEKSDVTVPSESQESHCDRESGRAVNENGEVQQGTSKKQRAGNGRWTCCGCRQHNQEQQNGHKRPMFEWRLFKNGIFLVYAFSMFFAFSGYPNVFQIILSHGEQKGISKGKATFLVSIVGIFDVIGRIGFGWFSDLNLIQKKHGFMITMAIAGLACLFMPLAGDSYEGLCILCAIFGLFAGSFYALLPAILVEGLGEKKLPSAFGLVALFMGTAFIYATFVVGFLNDITGTWEVSFYFSGVAMVLGAVIVLFEPIAAKREARLSAEGSSSPTAELPAASAETEEAI